MHRRPVGTRSPVEGLLELMQPTPGDDVIYVFRGGVEPCKSAGVYVVLLWCLSGLVLLSNLLLCVLHVRVAGCGGGVGVVLPLRCLIIVGKTPGECRGSCLPSLAGISSFFSCCWVCWSVQLVSAVHICIGLAQGFEIFSIYARLTRFLVVAVVPDLHLKRDEEDAGSDCDSPRTHHTVDAVQLCP